MIAIVQAALDAIRNADGMKFASLELDGYRIISLQGPSGRRHVFEQTAQGAPPALTRKPGSWEVCPVSMKALVDPNGRAAVWVPYIFHRYGARHHCGVESWTLFRVGRNWKIVNFADTDNTLDGRAPETVCPRD